MLKYIYLWWTLIIHYVYLVVIFSGETEHWQYIQHRVVKWWHPSCRGLWQWAYYLCSHHWKVCTFVTINSKKYLQFLFCFKNAIMSEVRLGKWFPNHAQLNPRTLHGTPSFFSWEVPSSLVYYFFINRINWYWQAEKELFMKTVNVKVKP